MYCSRCGKIIPNDKTVCPTCTLSAEKEIGQHAKNDYVFLRPSSKKMLVISLCGGLLWGLVMGLVMFPINRSLKVFTLNVLLGGGLFGVLFAAIFIPIMNYLLRKRKDRFLYDLPKWKLPSEALICMGAGGESRRLGADDFLCLTNERLILYNYGKRSIVWAIPLNEILECVNKSSQALGICTAQKGILLNVGICKKEWIEQINRAIQNDR